MSLNIKNEETVGLVRELANELGVGLTAAVDDAVRTRLQSIRSDDREREIEAEIERLLELWGEFGDRLGQDYLSQDLDELLYDENGLPK